MLATWPGAQMWVFPASSKAPTWITGDFDTIALRITRSILSKLTL